MKIRDLLKLFKAYGITDLEFSVVHKATDKDLPMLEWTVVYFVSNNPMVNDIVQEVLSGS